MEPTTHHTTLAVLWDIDGVLIPEGKPTRRPEGYGTYPMLPARWQPHKPPRHRRPLKAWLNPDHGPKILALSEDLGAENWWASAWWGAEANRLISPVLGLPEWPTLFLGPEIMPGPEWKWTAVLDAFAGRPLIWFDNLFREQWNLDSYQRFLADRGATPTLLHHVDGRLGLRDSDLGAAREWAAEMLAKKGKTP